MDQNNFPKATFSLKDFRFRDETFFNLFKKGTETKPAQIEPILQRYPGRKFVLVGDSGEQDPEVYASIARKYPDQIARIYIRNVNGATASDQRFKNAFDGLDNSLWQLFADPSGLGLP
jgi:phosphatidate phosphatase APP1